MEPSSHQTFNELLLVVEHNKAKMEKRQELCNLLQPYIDFCVEKNLTEVSVASRGLKNTLRADSTQYELDSAISNLWELVALNELSDISPVFMNHELIAFYLDGTSKVGLLFSSSHNLLNVTLDPIFKHHFNLKKKFTLTLLKDFCGDDRIICDELIASRIRSSSSIEERIIVLDFIQPEFHNNETFIKLPVLIDDLRQVFE